MDSLEDKIAVVEITKTYDSIEKAYKASELTVDDVIDEFNWFYKQTRVVFKLPDGTYATTGFDFLKEETVRTK